MTMYDVEAVMSAQRSAMVSSDIVAMSEIMTEDAVWIHASSKRDDKASFLEGFRTGTLRCLRFDMVEARIRLFDAGALVEGIVEMQVVVDGEARTSKNRFSAVWVQREHGPQLMHWQSTKLA